MTITVGWTPLHPVFGSHLEQPLSGTLHIKVAGDMGAGPILDGTHATSYMTLAETPINPDLNRVVHMIPCVKGL